MIEYQADGSVVLTDNIDPSVTQTIIGTQAEIEAAINAFFPPQIVPMYKVKKYLVIVGLLDEVTTVLDGLPGLNGELARIDWNSSPNLLVFSPLAINVAGLLGLTREEYYTLVRAANALP